MAKMTEVERTLRARLETWTGASGPDQLAELLWAAAMDHEIEDLLVQAIKAKRVEHTQGYAFEPAPPAMKIEQVGDITLTADYWDCECKADYIHSATVIACPKCRARAADQPDSRVEEVKAMLAAKEWTPDLAAIIQWGHESGGDLGEAIRLYYDMDDQARRNKPRPPTADERAELIAMFLREFGVDNTATEAVVLPGRK